MSPTNQKTFTFVLPDDLKRGLQRVKERDGISEGEQIRRAVGWYLAYALAPRGSARAKSFARREIFASLAEIKDKGK